MKKITRLLATVALLFGVVGGVRAEKLNLTFVAEWYCAASWDSSTNKFSWGTGGQNPAWIFIAAQDINGDLSSWETLHLNAKNFTNSVAEELTIVFKKNDGSIPPSGPTKEFVVSPDANGDITIDLTTVDWGDCDITNIQDLTIYGGERTDVNQNGSVVITDAYLYKESSSITDYWLVCDGAAQANSWDKQAGYPLSTPLVAGETYVLTADIKSAEGGNCQLWATWEASENKNQWGGTNDVQYLNTYATTTTLTTYTWEFQAAWNDDKVSFVFGTLNGKIYFDNVSLKKKNDDTELIANGDFSSGSKAGWSSAGSTSLSVEVIPNDPLASQKEVLSNKIALGQMQNAFGKTEDSFAELTNAIIAAEAELENEEATAESLTAKATAIEDAIAGFVLLPGYVHLTNDIYHEWTGIGDDATIKGNGSRNLILNTNLNQGELLYGDVNVDWKHYAKLVNPKSLVILGTKEQQFGARTDRTENNASLTQLNVTLDNDGKGIIDLSDKETVRINAIKRAYDGKTGVVSEILVEYKPFTITIGEAGFATFSADLNSMVGGEAKAYAAKVDGDIVKLTEVTYIPAGSGVIVENTGNAEFPVVEKATAIEDNELKVSDGTVEGDESTIYVLADGENGVGFYLLASGNTVPAGKAYLEVANGGTGARQFIGFDADATAIKTVKGAEAENAIYNLAGQRLTKAQKGLNIVNGKVVLVK